MGDVPDWYALIRQAKYLGVAPWDLLDQPLVWRKWAGMGETAEAESQKQQQAASSRKASRSR